MCLRVSNRSQELRGAVIQREVSADDGAPGCQTALQ